MICDYRLYLGNHWKKKFSSQISSSKNNRANGAYAIIQFFDNGDLLNNSVSGPFRMEIK